jgi:hypothetical protein
MEMSDRDKDICKRIDQGCKRSALAVKYDISRSRVCQIYDKYLVRKHEEETAPPLKKLLTIRMRNAMMVYFKDDSIFTDPARIMSLTLRDYTRVQNVGKYALESLVNGMLALGYVKKGDAWLQDWDGKYKPRPGK